MKILRLFLFVTIFLAISCVKEQPLGTKKNPIKMYFVPSMEAGKIITSGKAVADYLHEKTGYYFKVAVPTSYAAVIEAMGTNEADIAWLATFAYVLAHQKYGAEVVLTTVRNGLAKYRGQFVTQADSGIKKLEDINGKIIAYTDASSTSGYIYPSALLKKKGIKPKSYFFAGGHPQTILAVYEGKADVGCSFWSPEDENGNPKDARTAVLDTHPDVLKKVIPFAYTDWIPNDTVTMRKDFPKEMKEKIINALLELPKNPDGKKMLQSLLDIDDFIKAKDSDYDIVRETLKTLNIDVKEFVK